MITSVPVDSFGKPVGMPVLIPIPIPTRGLPWYQALFNLLFYRRDWLLAENFYYQLPSGQLVLIWAGFVFDGASIPRVFWAFLNPIGVLLIPGLLHDYAYTRGCLHAVDGTVAVTYPCRKKADDMFLRVCQATNGMRILNAIVTAILRLFGDIAWKKHRRRDRHTLTEEFVA